MIELLTLGRVRLVTDADSDRSAATQPKRIALLAYLAVSGGGPGRRRDELLAMFWPELGDEEARRALRQALHYLRRVLGEGAAGTIIADGDEVAVRSDSLRCDAVAFEQLAQQGQADAALSLYKGDFLQGFHVPDVSSEYEEWVERTRARLRRKAAAIAWTASEAAERSSNGERAVELARRACQLELDEEAGWRRLMGLQDRLGDRAAALRSYEELKQRLERDLGVRPAAETVALAQSIRSSNRTAARVEVAAPDAAPESRASVAETPPPTVPVQAPAPVARRRARYLATAGVLAFVAVAGFAAVREARQDHRDRPSLMTAGALSSQDKIFVADFVDQAHDSALATVVTQAIRVDLTQSPLVRVMSPRQLSAALTRMQRPPGAAIDDSIAREIALREGAKAFVTGSIAKVGGAYTITAQLVGAAKGEPLVGLRETASDSTQLIAAIDRTSKQVRYRIGESLKELRDMPALNQVTTTSLPALRKYTEGYRLFLAGRRTEALQLLEAAVAIDTGFSTAHRWLSRAGRMLPPSTPLRTRIGFHSPSGSFCSPARRTAPATTRRRSACTSSTCRGFRVMRRR
jgi:DNA-binding SARP family transcriptional activator/TolB-like protein